MLALILAVAIAHPLPRHTGQPVPVGLCEIDFELYRIAWATSDRCTIEPAKPGNGWHGIGTLRAGVLRVEWYRGGNLYLSEYRPEVGCWVGLFGNPDVQVRLPSRIKTGAGR